MTFHVKSAALSLTLALIGCSQNHDGGACLPGSQEECACPGGGTGLQYCASDYTYEQCYCEPGFEPGGDGDGSVGDGWDDYDGYGDGADGNPGTTDAGMPDGVEIVRGTATLLDVFVEGDAVWVVDSSGVSKFALDASAGAGPLGRWDSPRSLLAAAFDGTRLAVADGAKLSVLSADTLELEVDGNVVEPCASVVFVSGERLVCGPANDWDRIFYTYDALTIDLLASSQPFTYNGIPMRKVPGADAFVTVTTDLSPSDFHLYRLAETGEVVFVGESPYHGDFGVSDVYAFEGDPATQLVSHEGLLLDFDGCTGQQAAPCFVKNGALGTLPEQRSFLGMASHADSLFAVVGNSAYAYEADCMNTPCRLDRIDVAAREVKDSLSFRLPLQGVVRLAPRADGREVIVGARVAGDQFDTAARGYFVSRLAFE